MNEITNKSRSKLNGWLVAKTGMGLLDYPDNICWEDWICGDETDKQIEELIPDLAWEILDLSGMDRDTVDNLCYPDECDDDEEYDDSEDMRKAESRMLFMD